MTELTEYAVEDVITLVRRPIRPVAGETYREIGLRSFGKGIFHKDPVAAEAIAGKKVFKIQPGDLIFSNVFAWEGAVAIASDQERGMIGSHRFMTHEVNAEVADARYLLHYFYGGPGLDVIRGASPGSAGRNRTLGTRAFAAKRILLPSLVEQRRIAHKVDLLLMAQTKAAVQSPNVGDAQNLAALGLDKVLGRWAKGSVRVDGVCRLVSDTVHPGADRGEATQFVGLEHIAPHFGERIGSRPLGEEKGRKFRFAPGDILYGYLRPYLNKVWLADQHGLCSVEQYVLRPTGVMPAELIAASLRSKRILDEVLGATHNLQLPRLRSGLLLAMEIPFIPPAHQAQALADLREFDEKVRKLARTQQHRDEVLAALSPAILDAAFSGRL
ncbi:hypothetical protein [Streptomyces sp. NPDC021212]|uniref:hypothetical protein n=1 Tax=Streptomyces sp. NPDC021212 TaxID=3365118 RepID=UPI0037B4F129